MVVEPGHGLNESLLLCVFLDRILDVTTNAEAVGCSAVEGDLVWKLGVLKDDLGLVALVGWEDLVSLSGGNAEWAGDRGEFLLGYETRYFCQN